MLAETLKFSVFQVTVTLRTDTDTLIYCEKEINVFSRINNSFYKGNVIGILAYETLLYSVESTKPSKHQLLNAVEEGKFNS